MNLHAHLTFNGNCRQAMTFYQSCLGGKLHFQTLGDSPLSTQMPARMKKCILRGLLENETMTLVGTDLVNGLGLIKGNSISLLLHCANKKEASRLYKKLSVGATQVQRLRVNHFGTLVGGFTDRYGCHWIVQCNEEAVVL
mgnify:CR=1 FL=1